MVSWTVSANNDTAMTAYIAMRLAQGGAAITLDQAIAELLMMGGIDQAGNRSGPTIKPHGGRFA